MNRKYAMLLSGGVALLVLGGLWGCGNAPEEDAAHAETHDSHMGGGSFTQTVDGMEIFVEYPHQIQGVESEEPWTMYLTRLDTWRPVAGASVTLVVYGSPESRQEIKAQAEAPGVYRAAPMLPSAGHWHAGLALSVDGQDHWIEAGEFEVFASEEDVHAHAGHDHAEDEADAHAGHDHAEDEADAHAGHDHAEDEADAHAGHDHTEDEADTHAGHDHTEDEADTHAGHDHAEDEADAHAGHDHAENEADAHAGHDHAEDTIAAEITELITLPKREQWTLPFAVAEAEERGIPASIPAAGELVAPPGGLVHVSSPVAGLVKVHNPAVGPGDYVRAGQILAQIAPVSLDNSYARTRADVTGAQLEADRAERLYAAGAIPERRLLDAQRNLEVAVAAFEAIGGSLDTIGEDHPDANVYYLRSPINGVVAVRDMALGAQVEIGTHAFTIVNASTLWFVARVPARYAAETNRIRGAWFTVEGGEDTYASDRLLSTGSMIDPGSRTLPVRFAIRNPGDALKVGMLAEGRILLGDPVQGVAVPNSAIQEENNLPVIYAMLAGDTFERRVVETGPSDGSWTIVSGVDAGERVVTEGAYQVSLAALGTVEPAHDHAH